MSELSEHRLPWHGEQWRLLHQAAEQNRLPHAILLAGPPGLGKGHFVRGFAQSRLCIERDSEGNPCGHCRQCQLIDSGNHPDFQWVKPDQESKSGDITVDTIRMLTASASLTSLAGGNKVIVLEPAHRMNNAAANSLLKTLEEPTPGNLILLLTDRPGRLLATIRSRCQKVLFKPPLRSQAISWLSTRLNHGDPELLLTLANGAPLKALQLDNIELLTARSEMAKGFLQLLRGKRDPVNTAQAWGSFDRALLHEWLVGWVIDLIRLCEGADERMLFNQDLTQAFQRTADKLNSRTLHDYLRTVYAARGSEESNLNPQLTLENLLISWSHCNPKLS